MRIATILGNRPQFIKHALLSRRLRQEHKEVIIHTGQHFSPDMSGDFFAEMGLPDPDVNLNIHEASSNRQIGSMLPSISYCLQEIKPNLVLITGDTNSALAGALAASKLHIPIAHVEAGARCGDRNVPEEVNRILIDEMSGLLFCPTCRCRRNLTGREALFTGDTLYDAFLHHSADLRQGNHRRHVFVTIHREDNVDNELNRAEILKAVMRLEEHYKVLFPVHPRMRQYTDKWQKPLSYLQTLQAIREAVIVLTDSGGVQREAYFSRKPCVYIGTAGWPDLFLAGASKKVTADAEQILDAVMTFRGRYPEGLFGNGTAVERIVNAVSIFGNQAGIACPV